MMESFSETKVTFLRPIVAGAGSCYNGVKFFMYFESSVLFFVISVAERQLVLVESLWVLMII